LPLALEYNVLKYNKLCWSLRYVMQVFTAQVHAKWEVDQCNSWLLGYLLQGQLIDCHQKHFFVPLDFQNYQILGTGSGFGGKHEVDILA
jgi:hypothetical protein